MGIKEDALKKEENISTTKQEKESDSTLHENKQKQKKPIIIATSNKYSSYLLMRLEKEKPDPY